MKFRTEIERQPAFWSLDHRHGIMMLGSCFTDNIGARLSGALFDVDINPFGTSFNPASIAASLARIYDNSAFEPAELIEKDGRWVSMWHHSSFALSDKGETLRLINNRLFEAHAMLREAQALIITWGTAWVFERIADGMLVNNCHKFPASDFRRQLLDVKEIAETYAMLFEVLWRINPQLKVIITVSPVRHIADGLQGNGLSKSTLRVAAEEVCRQCGSDRVIYFPAYEAIIDDLRDYRFYNADMVHPSEVAVDYVYDLFLDSFFDTAQRVAITECEKFTRLRNHRVMNASPEAAAKHAEAVKAAALALTQKYNYLQNRIDDL